MGGKMMLNKITLRLVISGLSVLNHSQRIRRPHRIREEYEQKYVTKN